MTFTPRVREARELAQSLGSRLHAMIDISDGLALDLWRICQASGAGAKLEEASVLAAADKDAKQAAALDGRSLLDHVLGDGEDHELLLAVEGAADASPRPIPLGVVTGSMQLEMHYAQGRIERIKPLGFVHQ
jgi:thiamine-monophosphate kinase